MLAIERTSFADNHEIITLLHQGKALKAGIIPGLGGMLNNFNIQGFEVVDGIELSKRGIEDYFNTFKSSVLLPYPNRIAYGSFDFDGKKHQLICNEKALGNALHGFIYDQKFEVIKAESTESKAEVLLRHDYQGDVAGFPYPFRTELIYQLDRYGKLTVTCKVENTGKMVLPLGLGWHPYFSMGEPVDGLHFSFGSTKRWRVNEQMIPTGEIIAITPVSGLIGKANYDDCFTLDSSLVILASDKGRKLSIDCGRDFPFPQVYIPPHRNCIAIEPMTCPPDVYNNGVNLIKLDAGEFEEMSFSMTLE